MIGKYSRLGLLESLILTYSAKFSFRIMHVNSKTTKHLFLTFILKKYENQNEIFWFYFSSYTMKNLSNWN